MSNVSCVYLQRRTTGNVDFYKGWTEYKIGFGTPRTDLWIGLDVIHKLTSEGYNELRFDLQDNGQNYFAHYSNFNVADEISKYQLTVGEYTGTAGDSFTYHNGQIFSTFDSNHNGCAEWHHGAWWYLSCYNSNLNGLWAADNDTGITWWTLTDLVRSLNSTEMKIRQV
ncbi:hypothetical protein BsWGS_03331 [Bradybaena similaris]